MTINYKQQVTVIYLFIYLLVLLFILLYYIYYYIIYIIFIIIIIIIVIMGARGRVMVKALGYKPEGRGFDTR
jgi:hypothetical protein